MTFHDPLLPKLPMDDFTQADLPDSSGQYWRKKQGTLPPVGRTAFAVLNTVKVRNPSELRTGLRRTAK